MENIETLLAAVAQTQGFDDDPVESTAPKAGFENSESRAGNSTGVQRIGEVSGNVQQSTVAAAPPTVPNPSISAARQMIGSGEKRKRGRPPKGQLTVNKPPPPKRNKVVDEEEDVCFICFDGGSLVLCDRKGCPKAYHPSCIKRDEAFFRSKAKWNCGWHICSVCRKTSHYMCYTCTYSLCKGCTRGTDYVSVRGNKGFCRTCLKDIMLIENKDQANNESVQVDFDDKTSWEYLFKVYWVCLKEKLSLTLDELLHAKPPRKPVPAVAYAPQLSNALRSGVDGNHGTVPVSTRRTISLELNAPCLEALPQNDGLRTVPLNIDNHVENPNCNDKEVGPSLNNETLKTIVDEIASEPGIKEITDKPGTGKDQDKPNLVKDAEKSCICEHTNNKEFDKPKIDSNAEWASKDLLEFVAHVRNGDLSALNQFDVQTLLLDYIKRNHLRDPHQKSQILCDQRLKTLFGKPRVGHIEMLKLIEFHFPVTEDSQNNSLIPAGFVASDVEVDGNTYSLQSTTNSRKRKTRKKNEESVPQNNLHEYAAIDVHNINLIYLKRNLMENLLQDQEYFITKVIGTIVRIRTSSNDQKQDMYRLVRVVGTSKTTEPYKIGERTTNVVLEVLNLDKKEVVSVDAISNQEFTEDECRRLRQSIRCGLVKQFTVGEIQKIAMALQPMRIKDWLEAEVLRLNHLRDRANEHGRKKELREYVEKLEQLKSPGERQRRVSEIPVIHADAKMNPDYESEEESRNKSKRGEYVRPTRFHQNGRNPISPSKKGEEEHRAHSHDRTIEKPRTRISHDLEKHVNQVSSSNSSVDGRHDVATKSSGLETTTTSSVVNSPAASNIETEKLWHYRDPNGKIQGPFSMIQLRKWSTTGLFPPDMRIWTNHEQYDSLLLVDALIGHLHGATTETSHKPPAESPENRANGENVASEGTNETNGQGKPLEVAISNSESALPNDESAVVKENVSDASWPHCWDLLNGNSSSADDVQEGNVLPQSSPGQTDVMPPVCGKVSDDFNVGSQNGGKDSIGLAQNLMTSGDELQVQSNNEDQAMEPSEDNPRPLNIDLSSNAMESEPVIVSGLISPDLNKHVGGIDLPNLDSPTPETTENQPPVASFLELLSPTPRSNNDVNAVDAPETKQSGMLNFPVLDSGPNWNGVSSVPLSDVAEWSGYTPTTVKTSVQEWESGLASTNEYIGTSTSDGHQDAHASTSQLVSDMPSWLEILNAPIEFDALGEESVSDLLAEVDAMESQGALCSPTSAIKFAREFLEECRDDCFSSIEDFNPTPDPQKCDASGSTGEMQWTSQSSGKPIELFDAFDSFRKSSVNSSASSEGETNAQVYSGDAGSEFHAPAPTNTNHDMVGHAVAVSAAGSDPVDPGWGNVQGNINLVTVQGNVNLVLGGPGQGMTNLGWGANPGTGWVNPSINHSPRNGSLPWDGQRKYSSERFTSPRSSYQGNEPGFLRGRPPRGRQTYNGSGGGYSRPIPKGQRVCKFYESGHCKKGAFCDYLHP